MTKPLFRRTHQSKTNCRCLRGREHLPPAGELGQTARRGFLLALDFRVLCCCSVILPEDSFGKWKSFQDGATGQHHTLPTLEAADGMEFREKLIPDAFESPSPSWLGTEQTAGGIRILHLAPELAEVEAGFSFLSSGKAIP